MANTSMRVTSPAATPRLVDLPDILLVSAASFLATPSRAMFAAAMTAPSSSWRDAKGTRRRRRPSSSSGAFLEHGGANQWEVLDFEDIEKILASKLTDDDLRAILLCIDSVNKVKRLKLAGCVNIAGHGLEPLRESLVLQQMDLSLVGRHENPHIRPEPAISEEAILPILSSIVELDGRSLRQLQLPYKWCGYRDRSAAMNQILRRYDTVLGSRSFSCAGGTHTAAECFGTDGEDWINCYGRQRFTCYECMENVCDDSAVDVAIEFCHRCEKSYCGECLERIDCGRCAEACCSGCMAFGGDSCEMCDAKNCKDCVADCRQCERRERCSRCNFCSDCWRNPDLEEE